MPDRYDVIIAGAGVSGLMAAGTAAGEGARVLLLEKMEKPARKLRITGKGRCNLTNTRSAEHFLEKVRSGAEFVRPAFNGFDNRATADFFESIGVPLMLERGERIFPENGRAWDVAEALIKWAKAEGVVIETESPVENLLIRNGKIAGVVTAGGKRFHVPGVILATGGVSYPSTGSSGDGHRIALEAGHTIEPLRPALVPLVIPDPERFRGLHLHNVELSLIVGGKTAERRFGEMEFTPSSISGPIVLQVSRTAVDSITDGLETKVSIDLKPALDETKLMARIDRETAALHSAAIRILLQKLSPSPLHREIARQSGLDLSHTVPSLGQDDKVSLARTLKGLEFPVTDYRPFTEAIITAGGVELSQVDPLTMESKLVEGLYFAGELLDIDADTGGFNIQLACSTGRMAGVSAAKRRAGP